MTKIDGCTQFLLVKDDKIEYMGCAKPCQALFTRFDKNQGELSTPLRYAPYVMHSFGGAGSPSVSPPARGGVGGGGSARPIKVSASTSP